MGFAALKFYFFNINSALKPKIWTICDTRNAEFSRVGESKCLHEKQVVPPARVTLHAEARQLAHPSCLAPKTSSRFSCKRLVEVFKEISEKLARPG